MRAGTPKGTSLLNARGGIMNELSLPQSDDELTKRLKELHGKRRTEQARRKLEENEQERRRRLSADERKQVFGKTGACMHAVGAGLERKSARGRNAKTYITDRLT